MPTSDDTIAFCHACGTAMDVTLVAPFSNVECPSCKKHTRVKREFGPYTLQRRHAIGGMSMVFAGHDNTLDRDVAVKILSETYSSDEKRITAFEEEARVTASISHPHVVRVFKTGKAFNRFYIAMEMVSGGHLEHQIKERGAIPEVEALNLAVQVAEGLRAAHTVGLIHRDIKPGNILLDSASNAKIVDFGLALMTKGGVAKPDEMWATPFYVPPETIDGLPEDYRADVYAFGSTFYHVLAGKPPCTEESMVTTQLREAKNITPLGTACPHLTMETAAVIECAMAYNPASRFESYDQLIDALQSALTAATARAKDNRSGRTAQAKAAAVQVQAAKRKEIAKRNRAQRISLIIASLTVVAALAWGAYQLFLQHKPTENNGPQALANGNTNNLPTTTGTDVSGTYQSARSFLNQKDYAGASMAFGRLFEDNSVQEPTRTYCALESLISNQLNGNSKEARLTAKAIEIHLTGGGNPLLRKKLSPWMEEISNHAAANPPTDNITDPIQLMLVFSAALKNWEHGMLDLATPLFTAVSKAKPHDPNQLAAPYQKIAAYYLADHQTLTKARPVTLPDTPDACKKIIAELDDTIIKLATRGRAKFNIREWQLQLLRHSRVLTEAKKNPTTIDKPKPPFASITSTLREQVSVCDFHSSLENLKSSTPADGKETAHRNALIAMHEAAASFLDDLAQDINKSPLTIAITAKDGRTFTKILSASDGMLTLAHNDAEVSLPWSAFSPSTLIAVYREAIRGNTSGAALTPRHEAAICFQWLSDEKDQANTVAATLGNSNATFKNRWQSWMIAIQ